MGAGSACTVALVESDLSPFTPMTTPRPVPCVAAGGVEVGSGSGVGALGSRVGLGSGCGSVERGETDLSPIMPMSPSCPVPYVLAGEAGIGAGSGLCAPVGLGSQGESHCAPIMPIRPPWPMHVSAWGAVAGVGSGLGCGPEALCHRSGSGLGEAGLGLGPMGWWRTSPCCPSSLATSSTL